MTEKIAGLIVATNKDHVIGVEAKEYVAGLIGQIPVMDVMAQLVVTIFMHVS